MWPALHFALLYAVFILLAVGLYILYLSVHIRVCKLQTKAGDFLTPFSVFSFSICKNWTNDVMFDGVMHGVTVNIQPCSSGSSRGLSETRHLLRDQLVNRRHMLKLPFAHLAVQHGSLDGTWSSTGFWKCSRGGKNPTQVCFFSF